MLFWSCLFSEPLFETLKIKAVITFPKPLCILVLAAPTSGDTARQNYSYRDPRGQEAENSVRKVSDSGSVILEKIKTVVLTMSASEKTVNPTCQGPRKSPSAPAHLPGTIHTFLKAVAFHVRQAKPFSTPTLQLTPDFGATGDIAAVQ